MAATIAIAKIERRPLFFVGVHAPGCWCVVCNFIRVRRFFTVRFLITVTFFSSDAGNQKIAKPKHLLSKAGECQIDRNSPIRFFWNEKGCRIDPDKHFVCNL